MAGLVSELQKDALDANVKVSDLLRKAYVVATKLNIPDFKDWIQKELNGYDPDKDEIPNYRFITGEIRYHNPIHGLQPIIVQNKDWAKALENRHTFQSICEFEDLMANPDTKGSLCMNFSQETENLLFERIPRLKARPYLFFSRTTILNIIDIVKNTILEWSLKLEEEGITGDGVSFSEEEKKNAESNQNIHIENFQGILGNVTGSTVNQNNTLNIKQNDLKSLTRFLESKGVDQEDIEDLKEAVKEEASIESPERFGSKVSAWIGKMISKAAAGTWKIAVSTASQLLTAALKQYYGY
ncbi:MAG: hypothetical protein JW837_12435 [Sedimentisphaerales bacterium]|nr:hypothetical protein [Sedimentisphaerales bacterium]